MQTRINEGRTENLTRYAGLAMASAQRAAALTHRLLAFSRRQPLESRPVDANRLVSSMDELMRRTLGERVQLEVVVAGGLWLTLCDPNQLEKRDPQPRDQRPRRDAGRRAAHHRDRQFPPRRRLRVARDRGAGGPVRLRQRDRYRHRHAARRDRPGLRPVLHHQAPGAGHGPRPVDDLRLRQAIRGNVKIYSEAGQGTTVKLYLPRYHGEVEALAEVRGEAPRAERGETVLVVEDDPTVRSLVIEVLHELGYRTLEAGDGTAGLRHLQSDAHIDLLVTDVGLPGLNGRQLADQARLVRPALKVLFMTGYAENATFGNGHLGPGMQMITKPFRSRDWRPRSGRSSRGDGTPGA